MAAILSEPHFVKSHFSTDVSIWFGGLSYMTILRKLYQIQSINQSINQSFKQSTKQAINKLVSQSINKSMPSKDHHVLCV